MKAFCTKCNINWAALWSQDDEEGDEQVEFCPLCRNDIYLQPAKDGALFVRCAITGRIANVETGEGLDIPLTYRPGAKWKAKPAMTETEAEYERKNDAALEAYFQSGNAGDYFEQFKK